jgi:cobalt-zinc-cadmium efflux system outer membrane protein
MRMNLSCNPIVRRAAQAALSSVIPFTLLGAQIAKPSRLTLRETLEAVRRASPEVLAAREAVAAAAARERQAKALPNPTLSYQREQTSEGGDTNSQNIASIDQPLEIGGQRGARRTAARLRREAAEARLAATEAQLDFDVTRAYALAVAADRRATLAETGAAAFGRARNVSQTRLIEGDVSGYANRRIRLEAARYAGLLAEALLARRAARLTLASLIAPSADSLQPLEAALEDSVAASAMMLTTDSLRSLALRHRADLRAAQLEAEASEADARLIGRERVPVPVLTAGLKNEQVVGGGDFKGFIAGISLPFPLWDRRGGAVDAANADTRRRVAEADVVRRRIAREIAEAVDGLRAVYEQLAVLGPQLGAESERALRAAQVAYSEGEISLVEWLDAVRAYQEAESTLASLRAESLIRRAALDRAVGLPIAGDGR